MNLLITIREYAKMPMYEEPFQRFSTKELAKMLSQGKYLTPNEKIIVSLYADQQRKKKVKK